MLYIRETSADIDQVCEKLEKAADENKFGVLAVHDLKQKMLSKSVSFDRECRIFEVCNPGKAKTVLESDMSVSTALPCRISVYQEGGKVKVATLKPTGVLGLFQRPELQSVAQDVEDTMVRMIDAACDT